MIAAQANSLRAILLDPDAAQRMRVPGATPAAVLAPLFERDGELYVIFTRRAPDLRLHAGQISFPGGRRDAQDSDLVATALREAHEEIGLDPAGVTVLGALQPTPTVVSDYAVYPFVGLIDAPPGWALAAAEVDAIIELPLRALAASHTRRTLKRDGKTFETDAFTLDGHEIWGATARILSDLIARLTAAGGEPSKGA